MFINIISGMVLLKIIKLKVRQMLFLSHNLLTELFVHIFGKTVEGGVIPGQIVKDLAQFLPKLQDCLTKLANFHSFLQKSSVCLTNVL